ncbi:DNA polymerase III subunit delta [Deltaproteobacteria bacterium]|nr:DNA polymerase III subunit delta [Deltaproteobacteria bacterium]
MRLSIDQLGKQLSNGLLPVYIVSGDETLLVQEACDTIRKSCRKQGFNEREVLHVDSGFDWQELLGHANALSLFSDKKLIELRLPNGKPGDAGGKALVGYTSNPSPDNVLLIICNKLDASSTRTKWYKTVESAGASIQTWPIATQQLPQWIRHRLTQAGLTADQEVINLLAARNEGNLLAAAQEIEKLKLFSQSGSLDINTVNSVVADNARYDVFGLVDRVMQGDAPGSLKILRGLQAEGTDVLGILWALSREIRVLSQCASEIEQGNGIDRVLQNQRVWDKRKTLTKTALKRLPLKKLHQLLSLANQIDQAAKGIAKDNAWDMLTRLTLSFAGKPILS